MEVAAPSKVSFPQIYIFFEVMLISRIDGTRSSLEDYNLLILFDVLMYVCIIFAIKEKIFQFVKNNGKNNDIYDVKHTSCTKLY